MSWNVLLAQPLLGVLILVHPHEGRSILCKGGLEAFQRLAGAHVVALDRVDPEEAMAVEGVVVVEEEVVVEVAGGEEVEVELETEVLEVVVAEVLLVGPH